MGQGKILWYSHRLMHQKRVTCELHDSYFCSMTIKHAIPKTAEVTNSDGQLWGDIEWAIELLYNLVKTGSQWVWRSDQLVIRCGRESQHPAEWAHRPPVEQPWRTRKTQRWWPEEWGVNMLQLCSVSNSLSHTNLSIKWEVYFFLKKSLLVFIIVLHESAYEYTTGIYTFPKVLVWKWTQ